MFTHLKWGKNMGLSLFSEDGWVTNLGSAWAVDRLHNEVLQRGNLSQLYNLLMMGANSNIDLVRKELGELVPTITDKNIKGVAESLKGGLDKIKDKEVAIIA